MTGSSASASTAANSTSRDADVVTFPVATFPQAETPATVVPARSALATTAPLSAALRVPSLTSQSGTDRQNDRKEPPSTPGSDDCRDGPKASKSDSSDNNESPQELLERKRTTGTCAFYPSKFKECAEPRSCYDCLNFAVTDEDGGCMLSEYGRCVPARNRYSATLDYTRFTPANANRTIAMTGNDGSGSNDGSKAVLDAGDVGSTAATTTSPLLKTWAHFRADVTQYCERTDALCKDCRRSVFADYIENETRSGGNQFCVGIGGCVCIATCEARRDRPPSTNKNCFAKAFAVNKKETKEQRGTGGIDSVVAILGAMVFVVAMVFAIYRIRTRSERRSHRDSSNNNSTDADAGDDTSETYAVATPDVGASPSNTVMVTVTSTTAKTAGPRLLNLFGWPAARDGDGITDKDNEALSPRKHSTGVHFTGAKPSAPEMIEIDATAPTAAPMAIPVVVPIALIASAPMVFSVRATASAPDFDDMADDDVLL